VWTGEGEVWTGEKCGQGRSVDRGEVWTGEKCGQGRETGKPRTRARARARARRLARVCGAQL
jgi:hypothetical protein